jgi:uncharacterized SAM-binding protein YcdF (DUF218 family)
VIARTSAFLLLVWALGFALFAVTLPGPGAESATDAVVVLTGGPGRVQRGFDLLQRKRAKRMLVSGADRRVRPHELAAEYRIAPKLVECCVDLGRESVDTRSNAAETAAWMARHNFRSVRLVTTDWHMARARYELARQLDPEVEILSDAVPSEPGFLALLKEYNKYLLRRVAGPLGI